MPPTVIPLRRGMSWLGELTRGERGPHATVSNAVLVLGNDPAVVGCVAFDEFAFRLTAMHAPPPPFDGAASAPGPYPRPMADGDVTLLQGYLQRVYDLRISQAVAFQAIQASAALRPFHPVRDWLAGLVWDGKPRLSTWLHLAFGCPNDAYHEAVGTKFLVAAVRRVRQPGCKFDSMLVLEGEQDRGKSSSCRALFGVDRFSDDMPHDLSNKDAPQALSGVWGMEIGELGSLIRTEVETVKAFVSRQVDHYRPPYGREFIDRPRQSVLIGTTNETDWLRDPTGNRRFWPVRCSKAEFAWIAEIRDQLWAEAAHLESGNASIWLDDDDIRAFAQAQQAERMAEDVWATRIKNYVLHGDHGPLSKVRSSDLLIHAIGLPTDKQNRSNEMRATAVLRSIGWRQKVKWVNGHTERWWEPVEK